MAMIERAGYYRKAYTRADGTKVKGSYVPAGMIKNVGRPGKGFKGPGEGIGKLRKGGLSEFGYVDVVSMTELARHRALMRVLREGKETPLALFRKLNALMVYTRTTAPKSSKVFCADRNWLADKFGYKASPCPK
jgi:hypothetical protein